MLLGFGLRTFRLNAVPLRGDEAFTVLHWMREPLEQTLATIATSDPQPPLAYAIYRGYSLLVGSQEMVVRFLPALLNTIGIAALYGIGTRIWDRRLGLLCAFFYAVHPALLWHAQDARGYALWAAASPLALWLALRALHKRRPLDWALYVLAAAVACYLYYLELFFVFALNIAALVAYWRNRRVLARWFASQIAIGLLLAPWFLQERLLSGGGYGGTAGSLNIAEYITRFVPVLFYGHGDTPPFSFAVSIALLLVLALIGGVIVLWRWQRFYGLLAVTSILLPLLLLGIVSTRLNVFVPRYVLVVSVMIMLVIAALGRWMLARNGVYRWTGVVLLATHVNLSVYAVFTYYFDYAKSPDWRALVQYLAPRIEQADLLVNTAAGDLALTFYQQEYGLQLDEVYLPANPDQSTTEIEAVLSRQMQNHSSLWLAANPPNWTNNQVTDAWLAANLQQTRAININGLRVEQWLPYAVNEAYTSADATFEGIANLVGYRAFPPEPDNMLPVWLYWQPLTTSDTPLKVFVHLISTTADGETTIWSQDDNYPQNGRVSSVSWEIGTLLRDIYSLSLEGVPAGTYDLIVGVYDPNTGERLLTGEDNFYFLQEITIEG